MRKFLRYLFAKPLTWMGNKLSAKPKKEMVFKSLTALYEIASKPNDNSCIILEGDAASAKFIIFSDQHKGNKSWADDFIASEKTYIAALAHYNKEDFSFVNLGDSEELWKFNASQILPQNIDALAAEAAFQPNRYYRTFGNHDILWKNKLDVQFLLRNYFTMPLEVQEGIILKLKNANDTVEVFLTHGHQGDLMSDNNAFSTWIVAHLWMPIQRYLRLNINSPSKDYSLRNEHNQMMHEWSNETENLLLVTGHTHQPVFASGRYYNHPETKIKTSAKNIKPCYFNTGCCCFSDGDITGIEISEGMIRLVKWHSQGENVDRMILEEIELIKLLGDLKNSS